MEAKGRVVRLLGGFYDVQSPEGELVQCRARGALRQQKIRPCVGDLVEFIPTEQGKGTLTQVLPRKNLLVRPPMANLDQLVIVASVTDPVPNTLVLDKLIAVAEYKEITPLLVITKTDRGDGEPLRKIYAQAGFEVFMACPLTGEGVPLLWEQLKGKVSAFCGNSGVGKSTLLNHFIPKEEQAATGETSQKLGRGRHTTRHVQLYPLPENTLLGDTPGFSAVEMGRMETILCRDLQLCFREFLPYLGDCRFTGCSHTKEKGCAILEKVQEGSIPLSRHQSYLTLYEEAKNIKEWEL